MNGLPTSSKFPHLIAIYADIIHIGILKLVSLIFFRGTVDYLGLNHYTSRLVAPDPDEAIGTYNSDNGLIISYRPDWSKSAADWLYVIDCISSPPFEYYSNKNHALLQVYPQGLGELLRRLRDEYDNPPVRIMENGYADNGELNDYDRISYHRGYLREVIRAVTESGCNVKSYSIWSIMNDFEWTGGYR